jgi:DNA-binding transcriptional ArsR family regulator
VLGSFPPPAAGEAEDRELGEISERTVTKPQLCWDSGTAYDFFVSLQVLHEPAEYGLRAQWAAGVRARIPAAEREVLEAAQLVLFSIPLHWIHALPEPKDATTALWTLRQTPAAERLSVLNFPPGAPTGMQALLRDAALDRDWDPAQREALRAEFKRLTGGDLRLSDERLDAMRIWWSRPAEFGERLLAALQCYQEAFFAEEEVRIQPALEAWLARARDLAGRLSLPDLVEELSQGLRVAGPPPVAEWVLAPSFWTTPFVCWDETIPERQIWLFGARPADASLVPGAAVPDALLQAMKALSDPTRLRILRILSRQALIPAELARRLRLRDQTVTHHLEILRLAGLVQIDMGRGHGKYKETHATRTEAVAAAWDALQQFMEEE